MKGWSRRVAGWLVLLALGPGAASPAVRAEEPIQREHLYEVESPRAPARLLETPLAISVVSREEIVRARPGVDLEEALDLVPGVFAQSGRNFAQDTRVAIRGFGARAPFGVRGIRVLVDGVPNTLPDGQSEVDSIDLAFVDRIEVVRGPISSLYGGGGGGILSIQTLPPTTRPTFAARSVFGTDHLSRYEALARGELRETGYVVGLASTRTSGFRDHARARQSVLLTKLARELRSGTQLGLQFSSVWAPEAQDPGGLNASEVARNRSQARASSRALDAGEKLDQQKLAFNLRRPFGPGRELRLVAYRLWRDFSNALPIDRRVDYDRTVTGGSLVYTGVWSHVRWMSGFDLDVQQDRRRNHENDAGARGNLTLRQSETVRSIGPFLQGEVDFDGGLGLVGGVRYDWSEFDLGDRFTQDGEQSDTVRFRQLSPRLGIRYGRSPRLQLHANLSTAFQVPTTTELRPADALGGFDSDREPERSLGVELGAKGLLGQTLVYELSLFDIRVRDALVVFESSEENSAFRNAGEVRRRGAELALSAYLRPGVTLRTSYTYADYRYRDFDPVIEGEMHEYDGNREPNTPVHALGAELRLEHPSGAFAVLSLRHFSDIELDDANRAESSGAVLSDVRLGFDWKRGDTLIRPFLGVRNWTRTEYDGGLRPNAQAPGYRYFEPAPEVELFAGLEIQLSLREAP